MRTTCKKKKRYIYEPKGFKALYLFSFLSKKTKKREYATYQKCYEKYYGEACNRPYKKFWGMMLRKSIFWWLITIFFPILIILSIISFLFGGDIGLPGLDVYKAERTLTYEEERPIIDELEKQWAEEDRLEALQKGTKKL